MTHFVDNVTRKETALLPYPTDPENVVVADKVTDLKIEYSPKM